MEQKLGPLQALSRFWGSLNNTQKFITTVFISLSVVLLAIVSMMATKPKMDVLFSGLQGGDSGAIVAKLQENKVPYEVDGNNIKVPTKYVHEMRMQLASEGLPQGGNVGFEIFDKNNLGLTEFSQKLNYQRALQGELSRSIDELDRVVASRVHIAIPEHRLFDKEANEPTASVVIKLSPGTALSSDEVGGIVHLVSSAVEGLKPNRVTVVDTNGNLLSEATDEATGLDPRMSASQLTLKRTHEQQLERNIQSMLEPVVGANKVVVRVNATINFDRTETNNERFMPEQPGTAGQPGKGIIVSEKTTDETYGGRSSSTGGVPGVPANIRPGGPTITETTGTGNGYSRKEITNEYQVSKTIEHVIKSPGQIEKLSIAVLVDGKVDAAKLPAIRSAVTTAAGIDTARGDQITVESVAFDNKAMEEEAKQIAAVEKSAKFGTYGKWIGAVVLLFGFLFLLKGMLSKVNVSVTEQIAVQEIPGGTPAGAAMAYRQAAGPLGTAAGGEAAVPVGGGQLPPEEVAQVVRKWMSES